MKIAISIPDDLSTSADVLAKRLGMTRSGLIAAALCDYIAKHSGTSSFGRINAVYSTVDSRLDQPIADAQRRTIRKTDGW